MKIIMFYSPRHLDTPFSFMLLLHAAHGHAVDDHDAAPCCSMLLVAILVLAMMLIAMMLMAMRLMAMMLLHAAHGHATHGHAAHDHDAHGRSSHQPPSSATLITRSRTRSRSP